jgi:hypothetical protein
MKAVSDRWFGFGALLLPLMVANCSGQPAAWHTIRNTADEPMTLVFATVPNHETGLLSFFRKIGAKPGEAARIFSKEEMAKLGAEHDFERRPPEAGKSTGEAR